MVLVDTSVWIQHLRVGVPAFETLLHAAQVASHDFVIEELACGHLTNRREILSLISVLPRTAEVSHDELLFFIEKKSLMGSGIGLVDAHLLASAHLARLPLWTFDHALSNTAERFHLAYKG